MNDVGWTDLPTSSARTDATFERSPVFISSSRVMTAMALGE
jgi:hypothetical protein